MPGNVSKIAEDLYGKAKRRAATNSGEPHQSEQGSEVRMSAFRAAFPAASACQLANAVSQARYG